MFNRWYRLREVFRRAQLFWCIGFATGIQSADVQQSDRVTLIEMQPMLVVDEYAKYVGHLPQGNPRCRSSILSSYVLECEA